MWNNKIDNKIIDEISKISSTMFHQGCFDAFNGAISYKLDDNRFLINKNNVCFNNITCNNLTILSHKRDYSWQDASTHSNIHSYMYKEISEAKCIAYSAAPYSITYSLINDVFIPRDYYGYMKIKKINIYNIKDFNTWNERADVEIVNFFKQNDINCMIIKGYGIYAYSRDILNLAKIVMLIENSIKILVLSKSFNNQNI